ncbi:hypothetical protein Bca4012_065052 [Brassica carinata]
MVLQSKQKETPVDHRTRLTAQKSKQSRSAKQQWYQVSDSDDGGAGSDKVSTAQGSMPVEVLALRLNIYSKANVISTIASCLQGSAAMDILLKSQFGKLFELPVARCHNSTKLISSLLCHQLVTIRKFKLWFTFATHPLRFSLDEFRDVSGLNCGAFDVQDFETDDATGSTMSNQLFDTTLVDLTVICPYTRGKKNTGRLLKDEKCGPPPIHQRNLRPHKSVPVNIEELSSSGDRESLGPPQSGSCTHEDLKQWLLVQLEKLSNALSNEFKSQLGQIERNICRRFGMPKDTIHNSQKKKGSDDHRRQSASPESGGLQTQRPIYRGKKTKTVVSKPGEKKHAYLLRSGDGNDVSEVGTKRDSPVLSERETGDENESDNARTPRPVQNVAAEGTRTPNAPEDAQQPETPGTAVAVYTNVLCVRPQSYVSPPKITGTRRFRDQELIQVTWEESNPNLYRSVKTIRSSHPAFSPNPYSEPKVASTGIEDAREPVSLNVCAEKVPSAVVDVGVCHAPIVEESNPECPTMEEDEKY